MDIAKFQGKLEEICALGEANGRMLKPEQVKKAFEGMELDKTQLLKNSSVFKAEGDCDRGAGRRRREERAGTA